MKRAGITIRTWAGEDKHIQQAKIGVEKDQDGKMFYKITGFWEAEGAKDACMITYSYDRTKALQKYVSIIRELLIAQEEQYGREG